MRAGRQDSGPGGSGSGKGGPGPPQIEQLAILDSMAELFVYQGLDNRVIWLNQAAAASVESSREELVGRRCYEIWHQREEPCPECPVIRARETGQPQAGRVTTPDGRVWFIRGYPVRDSQGRMVGMVELTLDVSAHHRTEEALRESERRLTAILEASPDPVVVYDNQVRATYINPAFTEVFGWRPQEILGRRIPFVPPEQIEPTMAKIRDLFQHGGTVSLETQRLTKDGRLLDVLISAASVKDLDGRVTGMVVNLTDLTEVKRLEAQLRHSQKMEAIGTLAGGVAHDFNNILHIIMGYVQQILARDRLEQEDRDSLVQIERAAERASALVNRLLTFSRKVEPELGPLDLNQAVRQAVLILEHTLPRMISIETHLEEDLPLVNGDPAQIEQVLLNLAANAADAMPEGGNLLIETTVLTADQTFCRQHPEVKPGRYVRLSVTDTGHGMDEETLKKVFEPFFTTKQPGRGTGLGLATAYGIVRSHGGLITCYSELGIGTTFRVYLPVLEGAGAARAVVAGATTPELPTGRETILVVDDEEAIVELGRRSLEGLGYRVLAAGSGEEALEVFRRHRGEVDLVLLDLGMPGMGGPRCLKALKDLDPQVRVIIASGYSANGAVREFLRDGAVGYLGKPFRLKDLAQKVREVLDA